MFLFTIVINYNPRITLGEFILGCAFIGVILYFIFGADFFPMVGNVSNRTFKGSVKTVKKNIAKREKESKKGGSE